MQLLRQDKENEFDSLSVMCIGKYIPNSQPILVSKPMAVNKRDAPVQGR